MSKYMFMGGLSNHRRKGQECVKHWQFDTNPDYWIVKFLDETDHNDPGIEICHIDNLKEIKEC